MPPDLHAGGPGQRSSGLQQPDEACLLEMAIGRVGFSDPSLLHHDKARAIDQTPLFVRSVDQHEPRLGIELGVHVDDVHVVKPEITR